MGQAALLPLLEEQWGTQKWWDIEKHKRPNVEMSTNNCESNFVADSTPIWAFRIWRLCTTLRHVDLVFGTHYVVWKQPIWWRSYVKGNTLLATAQNRLKKKVCCAANYRMFWCYYSRCYISTWQLNHKIMLQENFLISPFTRPAGNFLGFFLFSYVLIWVFGIWRHIPVFADDLHKSKLLFDFHAILML